MAIDTAEKRRAISAIVAPLIPGVTPNATQDQEWRKESAWSYPAAVGRRRVIPQVI